MNGMIGGLANAIGNIVLGLAVASLLAWIAFNFVDGCDQWGTSRCTDYSDFMIHLGKLFG